jgi:hypothetical protein
MDNKHFSLEEFEALFPRRFESQEQLVKEYQSFLAVFEQLDQMPVPELSDREKAEIFRRSWQGSKCDWSWAWTWLDAFRRPAVTFAMGLALGCVLMFVVLGDRSDVAVPLPGVPVAVEDRPLTIDRLRHAEVFRGPAVERLFPGIENPEVVLEKARGTAAPQRVLYGTLDGGEVYVVWNL